MARSHTNNITFGNAIFTGDKATASTTATAVVVGVITTTTATTAESSNTDFFNTVRNSKFCKGVCITTPYTALLCTYSSTADFYFVTRIASILRQDHTVVNVRWSAICLVSSVTTIPVLPVFKFTGIRSTRCRSSRCSTPRGNISYIIDIDDQIISHRAVTVTNVNHVRCGFIWFKCNSLRAASSPHNTTVSSVNKSRVTFCCSYREVCSRVTTRSSVKVIVLAIRQVASKRNGISLTTANVNSTITSVTTLSVGSVNNSNRTNHSGMSSCLALIVINTSSNTSSYPSNSRSTFTGISTSTYTWFSLTLSSSDFNRVSTSTVIKYNGITNVNC